MPINEIQKQRFTLHRVVTGSPAATDTATLSSLPVKSAVAVAGYDSVLGFVKLAGGSSPKVAIELLERVRYENAVGTEVDEYVSRVSPGPMLSSGQMFRFEVSGGQIFVRIHALDGAPTSVEVYLAGDRQSREI